MKGRIRIWALAALAVCGAAAAKAEGTAQKHKLVVQISSADPKTWDVALNNVDNLVAALGRDNIDLKVVAYGPGLGVYKKTGATAARFAKMKQEDPTLDFLACGVTMKKMKLTEKDLVPEITKIPSGIVRIVELEEQGYSYVRP